MLTFYIKPGIEWTCMVDSEIEGTIISNEGQTFGQPMELDKSFVKKADFGIAVDAEYLIEIKKQWYITPRLKIYYSLYDVISEMNSLRTTLGFTVGYKLSDTRFPGSYFFNER